MGLFSKSEQPTNQSKKLEWFYTEEARQRFSKYYGTGDAFWNCRNEHVQDRTLTEQQFCDDMESLSRGATTLLSHRRREYDEKLQDDNVLVFIKEYIDVYLKTKCNGKGFDNVFERFGIYSNGHFWETITIACYEMLVWDADEEKREDWNYPRCLKENNVLILWLALLEAHLNSFNELLIYSNKVISAIRSLVTMITWDYVGEDFRKKEPAIFDSSFYNDYEYADEFVDKINSIVNKYSKKE